MALMKRKQCCKLCTETGRIKRRKSNNVIAEMKHGTNESVIKKDRTRLAKMSNLICLFVKIVVCSHLWRGSRVVATKEKVIK